jgi:hypothetical protein
VKVVVEDHGARDFDAVQVDIPVWRPVEIDI